MFCLRENITHAHALTSTFMDQRNLLNNSANVFQMYPFNHSTGVMEKRNILFTFQHVKKLLTSETCRTKAVKVKVRFKKQSLN